MQESRLVRLMKITLLTGGAPGKVRTMPLGWLKGPLDGAITQTFNARFRMGTPLPL